MDYYSMQQRIDDIRRESNETVFRADQEVALARQQIERVGDLLSSLAEERGRRSKGK